MATRRTPVQAKEGASPRTKAVKLEYPAPSGSPLLPTLLETTLFAIYPATLIVGSLFSSLHPSTRNAPYSSISQSYLPQQAPSYFAKKSNVLNVYFVKIGWLWTTLAFALVLFTQSSHGTPFQPTFNKRRLQALARYACITTAWIFVTQWFFGAPIIDRSFRWTGGKCAVILSDSPAGQMERAEMSDAAEALTHAACKAIGGQWSGGHDISGHVFLLILGSAMLWLESLPAVLRMQGLRESRPIRTESGLVRQALYEAVEDPSTAAGTSTSLGIGVKVALAVAALAWWMLLMTATYFHTWFEKLTGLLVAFLALYAVYFLPRAVPQLRKVLGLPGV